MFRKLIQSIKKKPVSPERGLLYECDNIRKVKGEERNNIKGAMRNYVADGYLSRLIASKSNQIQNEAIKKSLGYIVADHSDKALKKAGMVMLCASNKIKGLEELVEEIKYFAKPDKPEKEYNANEVI
jgi:hypothetical protein